MGNDEPRIEFKTNSHMITINGKINDKTEGKFFYNWNGTNLTLTKTKKLEKKFIEQTRNK